MSQEVLLHSVDFGILTFTPPERELLSFPLEPTSSCCWSPDNPLAARKQITMEEMGRQTVIAHNDPSPARDRVLRLYEQRHAPLNIRMSLPSLDGIKRAVEMGLGVALLPRRCALREIARAVSSPKSACPNCDRLGNCDSSTARQRSLARCPSVSRRRAEDGAEVRRFRRTGPSGPARAGPEARPTRTGTAAPRSGPLDLVVVLEQ
jgi:DNA-binding transcriptional LysR family regulator